MKKVKERRKKYMAIVETPPCKWTPPVCNDKEYPKRPITAKKTEGSEKEPECRKPHQLPWAKVKKVPPCKNIPPIEEP